jgi:hypothetical protein
MFNSVLRNKPQGIREKVKAMSFIDDIANTSARRQSEYFGVGQYFARIDDFKEGENRSGRAFVVLECTILDSDNLDAHPKGCARSWLLMQDKETTPRNVRAMLCGVLGISDEGLTTDMIKRALTPDQSTGKSALAGLKVVIHGKNIVTRRGTDFTLLNFMTADQEATTLNDAVK